MMQAFMPFQQANRNNQLRAQKLMTRSEMFPRKSRTTTQGITVTNPMEEYELVNNLIWRSNTSLPIVKVVGFKIESNTFPKAYTIEVQSIEASVKQLEDIELKDSLYLIQQCLFGVQALTHKYGEFDFHETFYGLNQAGNCKTWISSGLTKFKPKKLPLPQEDIIITSIIRMVQAVSNPVAKVKLNQLYNSTAKFNRITYCQFQVNLSLFANNNKLSIPHFLLANSKFTLFHKTKGQNVKRTNSLESPCQVNFRYESPFQSSVHFPKNKQSLVRNTLLDQSHSRRQSVKAHQPLTLDQSISFVKNEKPKTVESMLSSPNKLRQNLKLSKDSADSGAVRITSIKNVPSSLCQNEQKSEKTCASLTINPENLLTTTQTKIKTASEYGTHSNRESLIISNTNLSEGFELTKQENFIKNGETENNYERKSHQILLGGKYNFGGLLTVPLPEKSIKQSQQIDESGLQIHQFYQAIYSKHRDHKRSYNLSSSNTNFTQIWDWRVKMTKLLTQDTHNLKQSVYCGAEEKKLQPLPIKLEKLGKLGREIITSIIPEGNEN